MSYVVHVTAVVVGDIDNIERSIREYGDPKSVYYGEILLTLDS